MYFFNWSTGKDSALALYQLLQQGIPVTKLLTTLHSSTMRVSHAWDQLGNGEETD